MLVYFQLMIFIKLKRKKKMSKNVHPLFLTRGVPGTHDINLLKKTFKNLKKKKFKTVFNSKV